MEELLNQDDRLLRKIDNQSGVIQTNQELSGWGFFSPEISFFLTDFCREQLSPIQRLIFYAYFVNGMTLEEIADRFQSSHQAVHHKVVKIEKKLRYSWQYMDRWNDNIVTKNVKGKKVKVFNPNKKKEK